MAQAHLGIQHQHLTCCRLCQLGPGRTQPLDMHRAPCRLVRRAWRQFPSASAWVTVGFASLLLYLTVARKCTDGEYPEFCRLVHMQSNVDWV